MWPRVLLVSLLMLFCFSGILQKNESRSDFAYAEVYSGMNSRKARDFTPQRSGGSNKVAEILATDSIQIKQIGRNSLIAKEKALTIAARKAFSSLLSEHKADLIYEKEINGRALDGADHQKPENIQNSDTSILSDQEISNCIYDYSIENEKYSKSVYICEVRYRFDVGRVIFFLTKHGIECRSNEMDRDLGIKVAVFTRDFIKNIRKLREKDWVIQKYSSEYVVIFIRNCTKKEFENLGLRYALLQ